MQKNQTLLLLKKVIVDQGKEVRTGAVRQSAINARGPIDGDRWRPAETKRAHFSSTCGSLKKRNVSPAIDTHFMGYFRLQPNMG